MTFSCDRPFSYSPFEANVPEEWRNTTQKNLERLHASDTSSNPDFKVALISDNHYHYNDLADAVAHINGRDDISFVMLPGDITENGLQTEYELLYKVMRKCRVPYLTVIGNHDYLSNGGSIYSQIFGPFNYTFTFNDVKFIAFDNVIWEDPKEADYTWLESALSNTSEETGRSDYNHKIVISHIPPMDRQLIAKRDYFDSLMAAHGVKFSIHGHKHEYWSSPFLNNGITYTTVGSPSKRSYAVLTVTSDSLHMSKVDF
ncbi:MAG TPA: metallophosphoesterase [Chryseosolibacter sp.]|nr:metallophosphoesterase [Chryseosolibacter sp.]